MNLMHSPMFKRLLLHGYVARVFPNHGGYIVCPDEKPMWQFLIEEWRKMYHHGLTLNFVTLIYELLLGQTDNDIEMAKEILDDMKTNPKVAGYVGTCNMIKYPVIFGARERGLRIGLDEIDGGVNAGFDADLVMSDISLGKMNRNGTEWGDVISAEDEIELLKMAQKEMDRRMKKYGGEHDERKEVGGAKGDGAKKKAGVRAPLRQGAAWIAGRNARVAGL